MGMGDPHKSSLFGFNAMVFGVAKHDPWNREYIHLDPSFGVFHMEINIYIYRIGPGRDGHP